MTSITIQTCRHNNRIDEGIRALAVYKDTL